MEQDFVWFLDNHTSIAAAYLNRVIVIKNKEIIAECPNFSNSETAFALDGNATRNSKLISKKVAKSHPLTKIFM